MTKSAFMEEVFVRLGERAYSILIGSGILSQQDPEAVSRFSRFASGRSVLIVADSNTAPLYAEAVQKFVLSAQADACAVHVFPAGETSKHFATVEEICRSAFQAHLNRDSLIVALGGGVCGDLAGFAAAIYMRGIDFVQIPTSLLAMIDSSVGGKTGADLPEGKNLIGAFHQPRLVLMDPNVLLTLPPEQIRSGLAELLKHAILFAPDLFRLLEESSETLLSLRDGTLTAKIIAASCRLKAEVVVRDEREGSDRALLNLGHTFGHAVEKLQNFSGFSHGEAVAYGTVAAAELSCRMGILPEDDRIRIRNLFQLYGLPLSVKGFSAGEILETMRGDKKNRNGKIRLILPERIGKCGIYPDCSEKDILAAIGTCNE